MTSSLTDDVEVGETTALIQSQKPKETNPEQGDNNNDNYDTLVVVVDDAQVAACIHQLFADAAAQKGTARGGRYDSKDNEYAYQHPKTNPKLAPTLRYQRHRNYYVYQLNQFRHWWKTSRYVRFDVFSFENSDDRL